MWSFREQRKVLNLVDELFARFHEQLAGHGYVARSGQMVDATFVEVPRQPNKREENTLIKEGAIPIEWGKDEHKLSQKDTDARWTKKNNTNYYGYKNHINADHATKLVQSYEVTDASVHNSQVFDELLDHTEDASRSGSHRRPFRYEAISPQVRTHSFTAQPPDLRHFALITQASRFLARSPCLATPSIRFLFIGSQFRFTLPPHTRSPSCSCASLRSL